MADVKNIPHLPLRLFGFENVPAIPFDLGDTLETLVRLGLREEQGKQAKQGFTNTYRIGTFDNTGNTYLFGGGETEMAEARNELTTKLKDDGTLEAVLEELKEQSQEKADAGEAQTALSLVSPDQFTMSWTTFPPVYRDALPLLPEWQASLEDPATASRLFFENIATFGLSFNLLILAKVGAASLPDLRATFGASWTAELEATADAGLLYMINLRLFEQLEPQTVKNFPRFTPATLTVLVQDPQTKKLLPELIRVSGQGGAGATLYSRQSATPSAWLYALQAAKASVTVYGIWLGHVYHWHIPTAAMQMALWNNVPSGHPVNQLLGPQSNYLIGFDDVLLLLWKSIAPPTSIASSIQFLELINHFAEGRNYFDDDPLVEIAQLGLRVEDFTVDEPWDAYPMVGNLLEIWQNTENYVAAFVAASYTSDEAVQQDAALQSFIASAGSKSGGNLRGLPAMDSRAALARVLTSQIFRVTAHGSSRLNSAANPGFSFIANFPPCLQRTDIPSPTATLTTQELLAYLPKTGTLGEMMTFYSIFSFSVPYEPFIPLAAIDANLFFNGANADPANAALVEYRRQLLTLIEKLGDGAMQRFQWPLNVET